MKYDALKLVQSITFFIYFYFFYLLTYHSCSTLMETNFQPKHKPGVNKMFTETTESKCDPFFLKFVKGFLGFLKEAVVNKL